MVAAPSRDAPTPRRANAIALTVGRAPASVSDARHDASIAVELAHRTLSSRCVKKSGCVPSHVARLHRPRDGATVQAHRPRGASRRHSAAVRRPTPLTVGLPRAIILRTALVAALALTHPEANFGFRDTVATNRLVLVRERSIPPPARLMENSSC